MHANPGIFLVEDDRGVRQAMERILTGAGYHVATFESAEALQALLADETLLVTCRCLVCDVRLPGLSGLELYRRLAEKGPTPPWIFITAHDEPSVRRQAQQEGQAFLLKPFRGRALLELVAQAIHAG